MEVTRQLLIEMVNTKMPFGQYENMVICNLPVSYLEAFNSIGFPNGKLGMMLQALYDMKQDGTEHILNGFKEKAKVL